MTDATAVHGNMEPPISQYPDWTASIWHCAANLKIVLKIVNGLMCLLGQHEPNWSVCLLLPNRHSIKMGAIDPSASAPGSCQRIGGELRGYFGTHSIVSQWTRSASGSLATMKNGVIVRSFGYGDLQASKPAQIASLSKAITAVCLAHLIDEGRLSFAAPLGMVLAQTFKKLGEPVDARFKTITIEQLLKHKSGLPREPVRTGNAPRNMSETFYKVLLTQLETAFCFIWGRRQGVTIEGPCHICAGRNDGGDRVDERNFGGHARTRHSRAWP